MMRAAAVALSLLAFTAGADDAREKAKFKTDAGAVVFELKAESDGAKLVDATGAELARIKTKDDGLKVKDVSGTEIARLKNEGDHWKLEDGNHTLRFKLQVAPGKLTLKDANGATVAAIVFDASIAHLQNATGTEMGRAEVKGGKVRLTSPSQNFWTKAPLPPEAVAILGLDALSMPERAALVYALAGKSL